jgi:transcription antitermination factor NusG
MSEMRTQAMAAQDAGMFCDAADSSPQWFAASTTPRHEKHVSELLVERQIEAFLPLYRKARQWKKSRPVVLELPLFPTYVFVRITRQARGAVLSLPGVHSIVGSSKDPWPIPDCDIEALRRGLQMHKVEPHPYLKVGERVRIKAGLMAGVQGILVRKKNEFRMVLTLDAIMRSVAVEVDANDLELIDRPGENPAIIRSAQAFA